MERLAAGSFDGRERKLWKPLPFCCCLLVAMETKGSEEPIKKQEVIKALWTAPTFPREVISVVAGLGVGVWRWGGCHWTSESYLPIK